MKYVLLAAFIFCVSGLKAQVKILHYTETSGYDHNTRTASLALFQLLGNLHGFTVDDDQTGDAFNTLASLSQYDIVVFSNTSGNAILNATQRSNFEAYIANGGSLLGIHAATDTYRHSTANGSNTGTWDYYAELIGASVQENPNHVSGTPEYTMHHTSTHSVLQDIPNPWIKNEEYYYWEHGYLSTEVSSILEVETTVGPNNQVNSYDAPRPMAWIKALPNNGKVFYTALGHHADNFSSNVHFKTHIENALLWMLDLTVGTPAPMESAANTPIYLANKQLVIDVPTGATAFQVRVLNSLGQVIYSSTNACAIPTQHLGTGLHIIHLYTPNQQWAVRLML